MAQPKIIFMDEETLPIAPRERLLRKLPSGLVDEFIADEPRIELGKRVSDDPAN